MQYGIPTVSVMMVTYNHAQYIKQALDSVVNQETDFVFEIVISDDCSLDDTKEIIHNYHLKYPNIIHPYYQETNIGMAKNWSYALSKCNGTFVALLEGDDYWTDSMKLQKQVNFLKNNIDFSICFNRVYEQLDDKKTISLINPWDTDMVFDICDLALKNFMHTNSVLFRNSLNNYLPGWFEQSPICDYVVHMLNARKGKIKYLSDIMGVYRVSSGIWSTQVITSQIPKVIRVIKLLEKEEFEYEVKKNLSIHKYNLINQYCNILLSNNDFSFLAEMAELIDGDSLFVKNWMLVHYPNHIKKLVNSKSFKIANALLSLKNILK